MESGAFYLILVLSLLAFVPGLGEPVLPVQDLVVRAMMALSLLDGVPGVGGAGG